MLDNIERNGNQNRNRIVSFIIILYAHASYFLFIFYFALLCLSTFFSLPLLYSTLLCSLTHFLHMQMKTPLYMMMQLVKDDIDAQRKGTAYVFWSHNISIGSIDDFKTRRLIHERLVQAIPIRMNAMHCCLPAEIHSAGSKQRKSGSNGGSDSGASSSRQFVISMVKSFFMFALGPKLRSRLRIHTGMLRFRERNELPCLLPFALFGVALYIHTHLKFHILSFSLSLSLPGSATECLYILQTFGIQSYQMPINTNTGKIKITNHHKYIELHIMKELILSNKKSAQSQKHGTTTTTTTATTITAADHTNNTINNDDGQEQQEQDQTNQQQQQQQPQNQQELSTTYKFAGIECPQHTDILFGRGWVIVNHRKYSVVLFLSLSLFLSANTLLFVVALRVFFVCFSTSILLLAASGACYTNVCMYYDFSFFNCTITAGNAVFRNLMENKLDSYDNANSKREKTLLAWSIVYELKDVHQSRFLKEDKTTGWWIEVTNDIARQKVSIGFRDIRKARLAKLQQLQQSQQQQVNNSSGGGGGGGGTSTKRKYGDGGDGNNNNNNNNNTEDNTNKEYDDATDDDLAFSVLLNEETMAITSMNQEYYNGGFNHHTVNHNHNNIAEIGDVDSGSSLPFDNMLEEHNAYAFLNMDGTGKRQRCNQLQCLW
jgi:hypothetical protein